MVASTTTSVLHARHQWSRLIGKISRFVFLGLCCIVTFAPLYYMVMISFRTEGGYLLENKWVPNGHLSVDGYRTVIDGGFLKYFINSAVVMVGTVALGIAVSLLCAYRIVLNRGRLGHVVLRYFVLGLAIPIQTLMVPVFIVVDRINLYDTLIVLVLVGAAFAIPISSILLVNFLRDVPHELIEAMRADGAGDMKVLWHLILPLSRPVLLMLIVYDGLQSWNNLLLPLVLTTSDGVKTLPLELFSFMQSFGVNVPAAVAAVSLATLPMMVIFILGYRYVVGSLGAGFSSSGAASMLK
jgi:raffinose/stachyose/melibiose transport system permease protein